MDVEYSFGEITDDTRGLFRFADLNESSGGAVASFEIYEEESETPSLSVTLSGTMLHYEIENFVMDRQLLVIADYDVSGKLIHAKSVYPKKWSGNVTVSQSANHRVFLLDRDTAKPLCGSWKG